MSTQHTATRTTLLAVEIITTGPRTAVTLRGQADASTHQRLLAGLGALPVGEGSLVELRLSELEFCDMESARQIIDFADAVRTSGGQVRVTGAPNVWVHTMLAILDAGGDLPLDGVARMD